MRGHGLRPIRDALAEVASIGVGNGLTSLSVLMPGHRFEPTPMRCDPAAPRRTEPDAEGATGTRGITFDIEGYVDGRLGMILVPATARAICAVLVPQADLAAELADSALAEVGNIFASAFANSVGSLLGEVLFIGPPEPADPTDARRLGARDRLGWLVSAPVQMDGGPHGFEVVFWLDEDNARRLLDRLGVRPA